MKNINEMKHFLFEQMEDLRAGRVSAGDALASAALASRVICCEKLEMELKLINNNSSIDYVNSYKEIGRDFPRKELYGEILDSVDLE